MTSLMLYEFKKMFKEWKNLICIGLFIAFIVGMVFVNQRIEKRKVNGWKENLQMQLNQTTNEIKRTHEVIKQFGGASDSDTDNSLKFLGEQEKLISNLIDEYKSKNLRGYLDAYIAIELHTLEGRKQKIGFQDWESEERHKYNVEKYSILRDKNIKPIFEDYCMEGYNFLRLCSSNMVIIVMMMLLLSLTIECFSSEAEKGTYKLLFIQPVSKTKIFFSKFFVRLIVSTVVLSVVIIGTFVILGLKNGFGNLEYPTEMYVNGEVIFVTLKEFFHNSIPLLFIGLLFMFCFCIFISCTFNSTSTAVSIAIPVACLCMCALISPIKPFLPFSYLTVNDFLSSSQYGVMNGNVGGAIIFLLVCSVCLVIGALYVLKRKVYKK